jgi:hypothetical protein
MSSCDLKSLSPEQLKQVHIAEDRENFRNMFNREIPVCATIPGSLLNNQAEHSENLTVCLKGRYAALCDHIRTDSSRCGCRATIRIDFRRSWRNPRREEEPLREVHRTAKTDFPLARWKEMARCMNSTTVRFGWLTTLIQSIQPFARGRSGSLRRESNCGRG